MTFQWSTYVELASRLLQDRRSDLEEAYLRASISRAYYGVFGAIWDKRGQRIAARYGSKHQRLIMHLLNSPHPVDQKVGAALERLRKARNLADYEGLAVITSRRARKALNLASSIQKKIQEV